MELIEIGQIIKTHGIKGELKVKPFTDSASDFLGVKVVYLNNASTKFVVLSSKVAMEFVYVTFEGINDRNEAEKLRGMKVLTEPENIKVKKLESGKYYIDEIITCVVITEDGVELVKVISVDQFGSADVYTIMTDSGLVQFPFVSDVVLNVNITKKQITVNKTRFDEVAIYED